MPKAPGKNYRNGISLIEFFDQVPRRGVSRAVVDR